MYSTYSIILDDTVLDAAKLINAVNPPRVNGMVYTYEFPVVSE